MAQPHRELARSHFPDAVHHRLRLVLEAARKEMKLTRAQLAERVGPRVGVTVTDVMVGTWERQGELPTSWLPAIEVELGLRPGALAEIVWFGLVPAGDRSRRTPAGHPGDVDELDSLVAGLSTGQRQIVVTLIRAFSRDIEDKRRLGPTPKEPSRGADAPTKPLVTQPGPFRPTAAPSIGNQDHHLSPHVVTLLRARCPTAMELAILLGVSQVYAKRLLERGGPTTYLVVHRIGCLLDLSYRQVRRSQPPGSEIPVGHAIDLEKVNRFVTIALREHELFERPESPPYSLERFLSDIGVDEAQWTRLSEGSEQIDLRLLVLIAEALDVRLGDLCSPGRRSDTRVHTSRDSATSA